MARFPQLLAFAFFACAFVTEANASDVTLEAGFTDMYNLQFDAAHRVFSDYHRDHPDDPMGPVGDAAAYLFSEFHRLHVLQVEFFQDDKNFEKRNKVTADARVRQDFFAALDEANRLASARLQYNPGDVGAMFARVLMLGLHGDYDALVDKRNLAALNELKQARLIAQHLLAVQPSYYDAYLAVGVENYLLSLKPAPVRWFLHFSGSQTDKSLGLSDLKLTAAKGHYLKPYARLLLAVAAIHDKDLPTARSLLSELTREFPANSLYASELAKLH